MLTKQNEQKVSKTSLLLQDLKEGCTLSTLKERLRGLDGSSTLFVPANGLFWLRKGTKQLVQLKTANDFASCKDEYREKSKVEGPPYALPAVPSSWEIQVCILVV